jgi:hypothetical protein
LAFSISRIARWIAWPTFVLRARRSAQCAPAFRDLEAVLLG